MIYLSGNTVPSNCGHPSMKDKENLGSAPAPVIRTPNSPPPPPAHINPFDSPSPSPTPAEIRGQVDCVVSVMESNLERIMERGEGVKSLAQKSSI